jgi:hypothetical protein
MISITIIIILFNIMSTFKVQPIYGELIMGWLDIAHAGSSYFSIQDVLESVKWTFKGGMLGDYKMTFPTKCSETRYPDGTTAALATKDIDDKDVRALMQVLRNRNAAKRKRINAIADWTASYSVMQSLHAQLDAVGQAPTGLSSVYVALAAIWAECTVVSRSQAFQRMKTYVRECVLASSAASFLHVPTVDALVSRIMSVLGVTRLAAARSALADFRRLLNYTGSSSARNTASRVGKQILNGDLIPSEVSSGELGAHVFYVAGRRYYAMHGCAFVKIGETLHALSRSDLVRIHQFLTGVQSGLFATVAQACIAPGPEREMAVEIGRTYELQVTRLLATAVTVPQGDEVSICKAYKRAFGAYLGELAGPLCAAETVELWAEAQSTKHADKLDLSGWVADIRKWSASTSFNLGKVYKLCPAPDASPGLTMVERHEMVCNHNVADPSAMVRFKDELRSQILRAYIRVPGVKLEPRGRAPSWYGAYRAGKLDDVPSDEIHTWLKWEGTATMPVRSPDNPAVWKDSGLGWDTVELAMEPEKPRYHGNMLTRMIFDSTLPMPGVRHFGHEHSHKVDIKPEGHKDPARGIYSGNIRDRLNQSWMEAAVQAVAVEHPSFMIGADVESREERIRAIVERTHDLSMVSIYYSFDISGWSPRMPPEPQHASHEIWGDLYDEVLFRTAHQITDGTRVYMNKSGFSGWFDNPGANFEGYNGKEMTMILITLMSLAVKRWRRTIVMRGLATEKEADSWSAILLAYIDDGLAKMTLPRDRVQTLFEEFKTCTELEFAACGYTIERSKCYPSDRFAIFLNEPYLGGRHVTHGTRAAMTICAENTEEHTSLIERLTSVSTGCRGAVMAGLDATTGVMLQAFCTYSHLEEWIRNPEPVLAALWSNAPRGWGGLGLPNALQLGTSGSGAALEESIRTMQKWAQISTPAKSAFLKMARATMAERTTTGILMSPLGGRLKTGVMVETRVPDAVRKSLAKLASDHRLSRLAMDFLGYSSPESLDAYSEAVVPNAAPAVIQEQVLADLASAHPHALFSAFARRIEKSSTLLQLVGNREMHRIMRANRADAAESYSNMRTILML